MFTVHVGDVFISLILPVLIVAIVSSFIHHLFVNPPWVLLTLSRDARPVTVTSVEHDIPPTATSPPPIVEPKSAALSEDLAEKANSRAEKAKVDLPR